MSEPTSESIGNTVDPIVGYVTSVKDYIGTLATKPPPMHNVPDWESEIEVEIEQNDDYLQQYDSMCEEYSSDDNQISDIVYDLYDQRPIADRTIYDKYKINRTIPQVDGLFTTFLTDSEEDDNSEDSANYTYGEFDDDSIEDTSDVEYYDTALGELVDPNELIVNNINYVVQNIGFGKQYISGASGYPPETDFEHTLPCTMLDVTRDDYINVWEEIESNVNVDINHAIGDTRGHISSYKDNQTNETIKICNIFGRPVMLADDSIKNEFNTVNAVKNNNNNNNIEYEVIPRDVIKWTIKIPVLLPNGKDIEIVEMMADTGANVGCINTQWAVQHWRNCIFKVGRKDVFNTPGGPVTPKYCCHFIIPTKSGKYLKAILYLIDDLPVKILADLNMLIKLGYKFEQPKEDKVKYVHKEEQDLDLKLDFHPKIHKPTKLSEVNDQPTNIDNYENYVNIKQNQSQFITEESGNGVVYHNRDINQCSTIVGGDKVLYAENYGSFINSNNEVIKTINNQNEETPNLTDQERADYIINEIIENKIVDCNTIMSDESILTMVTTSRYYKPGMSNTILNNIMTDPGYIKHDGSNQMVMNQVNLINEENIEIQQKIANVHSTHRRWQIKQKANTYHAKLFGTRDYGLHSRGYNTRLGSLGSIMMNSFRNINFIMMKQSFLATKDEIKEAMKLNADKPLTLNSIEYLKDYPRIYGPKFYGFYEKVKRLLEQYNDVFAKSTYARRTMRIPGVRLGIIDKFRDTACYKPQYPLSVEQRKWMIYYTEKNFLSGYWFPIKSALNCIPFTMVSKKNAKGQVTRMRPALDCRLANTMCEDYRVTMPTLRDFDEIYAIRGLFTLADIKNMYDCIPLHKRDWPWAVVMTPLGLYQMRCLGYGWKNAPAIAQGIMNQMALTILFMLVYIDDILMKHPEEWTGDEHVNHLQSFLQYCRQKNILLSPTKFYPFVSECTSFGFKRTMEGSTVSDDYKKKILTFNKPTNTKELKEFLGVTSYIRRYLYNSSIIDYWLNRLVVNLPERGHIDWDKHPEAQIAFEQLLYLTKTAPILHNPTIDGEFCIKTDACNYGAGAVLYQRQKDKDGNLKWQIIDMMNKTMPKGLRASHSMVHEAWAIVQACQFWQFHLLRRKFIISTDNLPISRLFTPGFRDLNDQTQRQLLRLRIAIAMFNYEMRHVPGIKNELPDGLSRFTTELISKNQKLEDQVVQALKVSDTTQRALTDKERDLLTYYSTQISKKYKRENKITEKDKLNHITFIEDSKQLNSFNNIFVLYEALNKPARVIEHNYNSIMKQINKTWRKTMVYYSRAARYAERENVNVVLNSVKDNVLQSSEYSFNDKGFYNLYKELPKIKKTMEQISTPKLQQLAFDAQRIVMNEDKHNRQTEIQDYKDKLDKTRYTTNGNIINPTRKSNNTRKRYYTRDEFDYDSGDSNDRWIPDQMELDDTDTQPLQVTTRNQSKKNKSKNKSKNTKKAKQPNQQTDQQTNQQTKQRVYNSNNHNNNDEFEEGYDQKVFKVDYVDPSYEDITRSLQYRNEFMTALYGYRHSIDIFDPNTLWTYQNADTAIQCTRFLMAYYEAYGIIDMTNKDVEQAVSDLQREDINMYNNLMNGLYSINEEFDLLQKPEYDKLTDEVHNC